MSIPPSGRQYEIRYGEQLAVVVEVGGGVREYRVADRAVLDPYPRAAMCDDAHGAVLVPWPNRLAQGRYRFDGVDYQVAITEPDKVNAIHGLLHWCSWEPVRQHSNQITMGIRLYPQPGSLSTGCDRGLCAG
jgi:aldose 1-epimerase